MAVLFLIPLHERGLLGALCGKVTGELHVECISRTVSRAAPKHRIERSANESAHRQVAAN